MELMEALPINEEEKRPEIYITKESANSYQTKLDKQFSMFFKTICNIIFLRKCENCNIALYKFTGTITVTQLPMYKTNRMRKLRIYVRTIDSESLFFSII